MKLVIAIYDNSPIGRISKPLIDCVIGGCGGDCDDIAAGTEELQRGFSQAEQTARLTAVAEAIKETIDHYYSQNGDLFPKVVTRV